MVNRSRVLRAQPCWIDLASSEPAKLKVFYEALFGWRAGEASPEFGGYFMFFREDAPVAGALVNPAPSARPDHWRVHVEVGDVEATLRRAVEHGATVLEVAEPIGELGVSAVIADPSGAPLGLWEPHGFHGFSTRHEVNAPRWFELRTDRYDVVVPFYRDVFEWDLREVSNEPGNRYSTAHDGDESFVGVLDATGHQRRADPSTWTIYFRVDDVDLAVETVLAHEGGVVRAPKDTPFGRRAVVRDSNGVTFRVTQ